MTEMREEDVVELALFRALRGEVPPWIRAIVVTEMTTGLIRLDVYASRDAESGFAEVIESELEQHLPGAGPRLECTFRHTTEFSADGRAQALYDNPWAT